MKDKFSYWGRKILGGESENIVRKIISNQDSLINLLGKKLDFIAYYKDYESVLGGLQVTRFEVIVNPILYEIWRKPTFNKEKLNSVKDEECVDIIGDGVFNLWRIHGQRWFSKKFIDCYNITPGKKNDFDYESKEIFRFPSDLKVFYFPC